MRGMEMKVHSQQKTEYPLVLDLHSFMALSLQIHVHHEQILWM